MGLLENLSELGERASELQDEIQTEEAAKTALVMPFIRALGYDVFDPTEVVPEFVADVGIKRGEKVDYAICREGKPIILFECKACGASLDSYSSQLYRYFSVTAARIAVLTDGVRYRFYSDLVEPNKLDEKPFLELDLEHPRASAVAEVEKLTKGSFDLDAILTAAEELKYSAEIKQAFTREITEPSDAIVRLLVDPVYDGRLNRNAMARFRGLVKRSVNQFVSELVENRLQTALDHNRGVDGSSDQESDEEPDQAKTPNPGDEVVTTVEEMQGYYIVKAILRGHIDAKRIVARDVRSYFGVLLDDNNRKPICRLWFNGRKKYLGVFDADKTETRIAIDTLDDLFIHADRIRESAGHVAIASSDATI